MVTKNKIAIFRSQNWSRLSVLAVMILSGLYLVFYVLTSLLWRPSNLQYWLMFPLFPYSGTYWTAISAGFLFAFCGVVLILKLNNSNQVFLKNPLAISWSILSVFALLVMVGFLLSLNSVDRLDSVDYLQHTIHLAFKSNNESGFSYYLIDCDRRTFRCEMVARFSPNYSYWWINDLKLARLHTSDSGIVTVVGYNEQVIYEYSLWSK